MSQNLLDDGTCIPSHLVLIGDSDIAKEVNVTTSNNNSLYEGVVVRANFPENYPRGQKAPTTVTYDVRCTSQNGPINFYGCRVMGSVSSQNEYEQTAFRIAPYEKEMSRDIVRQGSTVLVLSVDGLTNNGIIIGTVHHPDAPSETQNDGHCWNRKFNGIKTSINKDGEYEILFVGDKLNDNGQFAEIPETTGTKLRFTKEGNLVLDDAQGESIVLDKANKKITVNARAKSDTIEGDWTVEVKGNVNIHAKGDVSINSDSNVYLGARGAKENIVLGKQLLSALKALIQAFTEAPFVGNLGAPSGPPVMLSAPLRAVLELWKAKNVASPKISPILAKKKFTE